MGELEPDQRQQADFSSAVSRLWVQADRYGIRLGLSIWLGLSIRLGLTRTGAHRMQE